MATIRIQDLDLRVCGELVLRGWVNLPEVERQRIMAIVGRTGGRHSETSLTPEGNFVVSWEGTELVNVPARLLLRRPPDA